MHYRSRKLQRDKRKLQAKVDERTEELREQAEELKELNVLVEESKEEVVLQNEKLIQHKNNLEKIVNERTQELLKAKEKAEESDRLKSSFLANMSHEIRTPLNAIVGFSRIITETSTTEEERVGYSSIINDSSDSLLMLVNDILDFSSIEANQLVINKTTFYINELFDNLYSSFQLSKKSKDVDIVINCSDKSVKVYTDKLRLRQILANLLQNAFKFTKEGFIELGYYIKSGNLVMYVKDTGSGISKSEQKHIFDRFRKSDNQNDKVIRGIGLGLTISKRLGEMLDCNLTVESKTGNGSIFYLSIPVEKIIQQE
jgi:signal transduction histidine kinase